MILNCGDKALVHTSCGGMGDEGCSDRRVHCAHRDEGKRSNFHHIYFNDVIKFIFFFNFINTDFAMGHQDNDM